ncbi:MAG: zf-HC2 domain-containing protein [Ktedonobacteraceae bacterium]|nr:zf-HC2 domain-containing protein [Ktedonobacteraceae bacterium]
MDCSKADRQIQLYLDQRLTLDQIRALERHLGNCRSCQREYLRLAQVEQALHTMEMVAEPSDLTRNIMQRVAVTPQYTGRTSFDPLRPSLRELGAAVLLATITTLGVIMGQPSLRAVLPFANGHDALSLAFLSFLQVLSSVNSGTLMLALWVVGTILGLWITFALAGHEMRRTEWFKHMMERLPVR